MHGAVVDAVETVHEALELFERRAPNIIVTDLDLPDASGFDLIGELRLRGEETPAIAVSGSLGDRASVLERGFQACLPKPVSSAVLTETVSRVASSRWLL